MLRATLLLIACGSLAGCLRSTQFQCENDSACGANGRGESGRRSQFADRCELERRTCARDTGGLILNVRHPPTTSATLLRPTIHQQR